MSQIDYAAMAEHHAMSERQIRRWENDQPIKFKYMLSEYLDSIKQEDTTPENGSIVITVASLKGGVGKSTISEALSAYLGEGSAIVLNLDIAQASSEINSSKTIDYLGDSDYESISAEINRLKSSYKYVIIDTPGEISEAVVNALKESHKVIIPMTIGKRTREATKSTLEVFFGGHINLKQKLDVFFFFNAYTDNKKRDEALREFNIMYVEFLNKTKIDINASIGTLDASNAIATAEENKKSIFELYTENRAAYSSAVKKVTQLCVKIEEHFNL